MSEPIVLDYAAKLGDDEPATLRADAARLWRLALPSIGFAVSRLVLGQMDFVMLTWTGTDAVAAISPATFLVFVVQSVGMGLAMSAQTFAAQALGRGRPKEGAAYVWQAIYVAGLFAMLSWPMIAAMPRFWAWIGHAPAVRELEIAYCQITFISMAFSVVCAALDGYFNGLHKPRITLTSILAAVVVNGFWNYVLIFGKLGFPAMGIRGAAIATVLAWIVRSGIMFCVFMSPRNAREFGTRDEWRFNWNRLAAMVRVGGPTGVQWILDIGAWFVFMACLVGPFGKIVLAASNLAVQYTYYSFMPAIGIGIAVASKVGHSIGRHRPDLARRYTRVGMIMAGSYMLVMGLILALFRTPLIALFSSDPEVIRIGATLMIWVAVFQVFDAMQIIYTNALRGAGETRFPAIAVAVHCWVIFVGGGWLMTHYVPSWGYHGPWMTGTLYIALLGLVLWRRFESGRWERIQLFKDDAAPASGGPFEGPLANGPLVNGPLSDSPLASGVPPAESDGAAEVATAGVV